MADPTPQPPKKPAGNPALRMLGLPAIPMKLPSRNWMIFWTVSAAVTGAIIYDRREKRRATRKWAHAVAHLAKEPCADPLAMPRKLTVYLSLPPGDGLRTSQDYFTEYVKPVLAASGLDWEFCQGRRQGDVRAVVAERIRKARRASGVEEVPEEEKELDRVLTEEEQRDAVRKAAGIADYEGIRGDVVIGRHTWKEYVRGVHEGWLGPLVRPPPPETLDVLESSEGASTDEKKAEDEKKEEEESKPKLPPQIPAHNTPDDYPASSLPLLAPAEMGPAAPIPQRHILGFLNTPTRMAWFFNRRALAEEIGREVAAACLAAYRPFEEYPEADYEGSPRYEQQRALESEEKNWVKSIWKSEEPPQEKPKDDANPSKAAKVPEYRDKTWVQPVVMDSRIATRMMRFELRPEDEARVREIVVPETEIEGVIKGSLRQLGRWAYKKIYPEKKGPNVGDIDAEV